MRKSVKWFLVTAIVAISVSAIAQSELTKRQRVELAMRKNPRLATQTLIDYSRSVMSAQNSRAFVEGYGTALLKAYAHDLKNNGRIGDLKEIFDPAAVDAALGALTDDNVVIPTEGEGDGEGEGE